jgi:hypothetical protein
MNHEHEPGSAAARWQAGIEPECPRVFRPVTLREAVDVAAIIARDQSVGSWSQVATAGIVYDLMPGHLRPARSRLAEALGITERTLERRELVWEMADTRLRFDLVARSTRLLLLLRAAAA